jgi:tetratricopeptide (TPR) repeat protein
MSKRRTQDVVHVVMTDHLIRRRPGGPELLAPLAETEPVLTGIRLLDASAPQGPLGEVYRSAAVARMATAAAAVDHLEKMLAAAQPPEPEPWLDLVQGQLKLRRFAEADRTASTLLERFPAQAQARDWLALARAGQGKTDEAIEILGQAGAGRIDAEYNLGRLLAFRGRAQEAEEHLARAVAARPNLVAAWYNLGEVRASLGWTDNALGCWRHALEIDPTHTASYLALARTLLTRGDRAGALRWLRHGATAAARKDEVAALLREQENSASSP